MERKGNYRVGKVASHVASMKVGDSVLCHEVGVNYAAFWTYAKYHRLAVRFKSRKTREGIRVERVA